MAPLDKLDHEDELDLKDQWVKLEKQDQMDLKVVQDHKDDKDQMEFVDQRDPQDLQDHQDLQPQLSSLQSQPTSNLQCTMMDTDITRAKMEQTSRPKIKNSVEPFSTVCSNWTSTCKLR